MANKPGKWRGIGLLGVFATAAALGAAKQSTAGSAQDEATAKTILSELLAIDTTYEKGTVAAVEALRTRFLAAGFPAADLVVVANLPIPRSRISSCGYEAMEVASRCSTCVISTSWPRSPRTGVCRLSL